MMGVYHNFTDLVLTAIRTGNERYRENVGIAKIISRSYNLVEGQLDHGGHDDEKKSGKKVRYW